MVPYPLLGCGTLGSLAWMVLHRTPSSSCIASGMLQHSRNTPGCVDMATACVGPRSRSSNMHHRNDLLLLCLGPPVRHGWRSRGAFRSLLRRPPTPSLRKPPLAVVYWEWRRKDWERPHPSSEPSVLRWQHPLHGEDVD